MHTCHELCVFSGAHYRACREAGQWFECGIERVYPDPSKALGNSQARYRLVDTVLQPLEGMVKDPAMHQALLGSP